MTLAPLYTAISAARMAHASGHVITADTYLRHALGEANRLRRNDYKATIMRCRNRLAAQVRRAA